MPGASQPAPKGNKGQLLSKVNGSDARVLWRPQPPLPPSRSCSNLCPNLRARRSHKQILRGVHLFSSLCWSLTTRTPAQVKVCCSGSTQAASRQLPIGKPPPSHCPRHTRSPPPPSVVMDPQEILKRGPTGGQRRQVTIRTTKKQCSRTTALTQKVCSFGSSHHRCMPTWDRSSRAARVVQGTMGRGKHPQKFCNI